MMRRAAFGHAAKMQTLREHPHARVVLLLP
jgi:hypothetical protein